MKKLVLSLLLGGFALAANAQFGVKAGATLSTMAQQGEGYSRSDVESKSVVGPVIGLTYEMNLGDIITIQPELIYSQSGGKNTYNVLTASVENTHRINYLELPVLAKLKLGNEDRQGMGFYLAAGPWLGYALNGKYKLNTTIAGTPKSVEEDYTFDDADDAKRLNYGLIGAAGVTFGRLGVDLRYNYGLNNLLDADANNNNDNKPILQTRGIAVTLGYSF